MPHLSLSAAAALAVFVSSPSLAQSSDVRCLILSNAFAKSSTNADAKKIAQSGALFYLGKVVDRWNDVQLRSTLLHERKAITAVNAGPQMQSCVKQMQASIKKLQSLAH